VPHSTDSGGDWVLVLGELFDGRLAVLMPSDTVPREIGLFDPAHRQPGSRHRLALPIPASDVGLPIHLRLDTQRQTPVRIEAMPLERYLAEDLVRVRATSALIATQLLLGVVAAIYAVALGRRRMLLFCAWIASAVTYQLVMTGEIVVWLPPASADAMMLASVGGVAGVIAAYGFFLSFLEIEAHMPRVARVFAALLWGGAGLIIAMLALRSAAWLSAPANLLLITLTVMAFAVAAVRAHAGSPQGWFFLLGWGAAASVSAYRALSFQRGLGTPEWLELAHPAANAFAALVLVLATARAARYAEREMHAARVLARTDPLTRLPNRGHLDYRLAEMMDRTAVGRLTLMFVDIDRFKSINDRYGHAVGDLCLTAVARTLRQQVRASDLIARYGGEEFVLVVEAPSPAVARELAETIRRAVQDSGREIAGKPVRVTASIGVATCRWNDSAATLLARADAALYRAKAAGRNRVETDSDASPALPVEAPA
jgi:diguanylate cyclase (GGDEF)-like protein